MNAKLTIALALALGAAGCGLKPVPDKPTATEPAFVFPHSTHVDADVACTNCHGSIEKATKLEANVRHVKIPASPSKNKACSDCHDTDPKLDIPARTKPFRLSFSHADHLPRVKGDCKRCHKDVPEAKAASYQYPSMSVCTSCHYHQQEFAQARCMPCHTDLKGYKPEMAFKHEGQWLRQHGALAHPTAESCAACHDQTYCAACHAPETAPGRPSIIWPEQVERAFIHRGDYVSRHMIDEAANPASCRRCHGSGFCDACHEQQGLSKFSTSFRLPPSHGEPNWVTPAVPGQKPKHGEAARRDIASCAGCHDQGAQATCVACHQVGGVAGGPGQSPHPKKFLSKHDADDRQHNSMCKACHHGS